MTPDPVAPAPVAIVAPVGPVQRGSSVTLNASGSTNVSSFSWAQTGGPTVNLNTSNPAKPTFVFPTFTFSSSSTATPAEQSTAPITFHLTVTGPGGTAGTDVAVSPSNDSLAITSTRFRTGNREFRIDGTTTQPNRLITIHNGPGLTGPVIGTATADALGVWSLKQKPAALTSITVVSVESRGGGFLGNVPITQTN